MASRQHSIGSLMATDRYRPTGSLIDQVPPMSRPPMPPAPSMPMPDIAAISNSPTLHSLSRYFTQPMPPTTQGAKPGGWGNVPTDQAEIPIPGDPRAMPPDQTMQNYFYPSNTQADL